MKIVLFDFCMNFGGSSQGSLFLLSRLQSKGYKVFVIDAYGQNKNYKDKAIEYNLDFRVALLNAKRVYIGQSGYKRKVNTLIQIPSFIRMLYSLHKQLKSISPDVIIVNNRKSLFLISILKKKMKFKTLMYYRGEAIVDHLPSSFPKIVGKNADAIITHSKRAFLNLKNIIPNEKHKIYLTQNCIDMKVIDDATINNDFPVSERFTLLLAAGRPVKEKGHDIAIKSIASLKSRGLKVNLIIPGSIPVGHSNEYYNYLTKLVEDNFLEDQVKFIGWRNNFVGDLIQCDAIVLPSHTEGFPRAIIEAMLLGIPVCATPVGGIPEAIIHNETGMLFEIDNIDQLSECIYKLATDIELKNKISKKSKEFAIKYFSSSNNTNDVSTLLEKITSNKISID